jgi:hypothetical protein
MEQEIREFIRRELPRLLTEDPELHNWVWTIVHEHSFSRAETESRFDRVLDEMAAVSGSETLERERTTLNERGAKPAANSRANFSVRARNFNVMGKEIQRQGKGTSTREIACGQAH